MKSKIDFVITWVDGSDKEWLREKSKYDKNINIDDSINRYRDWDNLKYWFRGVEKFASWVNKIYFITYGHLPKFLDVTNEKLVIINHEDFINKKYLPVFNSNAIEFNIKNIKELSENFVLFNDDMFIIDSVKPSDFFKNDLPRDEYGESAISITNDDNVFPFTLLNNLSIINKYYKKEKNIFDKRYYNLKYGKNLIRTLFSLPYDNYIGFYNPHNAQSFKKSYFDKLYSLEKEKYENTARSKFRSKDDLTQYLIRYMQLLDKNFIPRKSSFSAYYTINDNNDSLIKHIKKRKSKLICINDTNPDIDYKKCKIEINEAFQEILPEKSSFEK